jgi:hypothetical protein
MNRKFRDLRPKKQRRHCREAFDLRTAVVTADAPVAEVLAIIAQQVEGVFAQSRARALHNLLRRILRVQVLDDT